MRVGEDKLRSWRARRPACNDKEHNQQATSRREAEQKKEGVLKKENREKERGGC
jgi:hypothetical protein